MELRPASIPGVNRPHARSPALRRAPLPARSTAFGSRFPMCGIVGYVGRQRAAPLILEGLKRLEYRGYDSAGIAVHQGNRLEIAKRISNSAPSDIRASSPPPKM